MSDEPFVAEEAGEAPAPVIHEPTPEEIEAARRAAIEANDLQVAEQLKRMSRRGFIGLGAGAVAAIAAWKWLGSRPASPQCWRPSSGRSRRSASSSPTPHTNYGRR